MLDQELEKYAKTDHYPFHMPGHKRRNLPMSNPYAIDITEIPGFDNLHDPKGLILNAMERMAKLYGAKKSYLLVGGSTCGNLSGIFAAVPQGGKMLIGRNSHKSIYHGAWLRECDLYYTYPIVNSLGIPVGTPLDEYRRALDEEPDIQAVVVTSPTYEGVMEPLDEIVSLAHERKIPVIVDAAHGAHLGFHPNFPKSPIESGADAVIMSLHKTLPALTQTAVLHITETSMIDTESVETYLDIFETSSPSYVLMSSICQCIDFLEQQKPAFASYDRLLENFYRECSSLEHLHIWRIQGQDPSKIVVDTSETDLSGSDLERILLEQYHIVLEMSSFSYGLAMSSVMDTEEGFRRLIQALREIDQKQEKQASGGRIPDNLYGKGRQIMPYYRAMAERKEKICLTDAAGRIAGAAVAIYPPGVPLVVPGEEITEHHIRMLQQAEAQGLTITGLNDDRVSVVI